MMYPTVGPNGGVAVINPKSFPEITITTTYGPSHFVHDRGQVQESKSEYKVGDFTAEYPGPLLPQVITLRKGWGKDGKSDAATVKEVAKAFLGEVLSIHIPKVDKEWTPEQYARHKEPNTFSIPSSGGSHKKYPTPVKSKEPQFHQPTEDMVEIDGKKYFQVTYWTTKQEGRGPWHGPPFVTIWCERYYLFDVADGAIYSGNLHHFDIPN